MLWAVGKGLKKNTGKMVTEKMNCYATGTQCDASVIPVLRKYYGGLQLVQVAREHLSFANDELSCIINFYCYHHAIPCSPQSRRITAHYIPTRNAKYMRHRVTTVSFEFKFSISNYAEQCMTGSFIAWLKIQGSQEALAQLFVSCQVQVRPIRTPETNPRG